MKRIKSLTVQGFRGFNKLQEPIEFHDKLTLISGQNSYGKTSISEALEWLLYGITSKIEDASHNKSEYLGSYRNIHFPEDQTPFVEAVFVMDDGSEVVYRGELQADEAIQRYINGQKVDNWTWAIDAINDPRPFILQHALKNLLLTNPSDRYQRFTKLIGEEELADLQDHFISLSTKYAPPREVTNFLNSFSDLEEKIKSLPSLEKIFKLYQKSDFDKLFATINTECSSRIGKSIADTNEILFELKNLRGISVAKYFDQQLVLESFSDEEEKQISDDTNFLINAITDEFSSEYLDLIKLATIQHIIDRAKFFNHGLAELLNKPKECPFCGHPLAESETTKIQHECNRVNEEESKTKKLQAKREEINSKLKALRKRFEQGYSRLVAKSDTLLSLDTQEVLHKLETVFGIENKTHFDAVNNAIEDVRSKKEMLNSSYQAAVICLDDMGDSLVKSTETPEKIKNLADVLVKHISDIDVYKKKIKDHATTISVASKVLTNILDLQAGTQELSVLIELLERRDLLNKRAVIIGVLGRVKELQKQVKEYVSNKIENTVNVDLTRNVLSWYERIKTEGDPDVHFNGFELPKTKSGAINSTFAP
ncbi:MAG: AAA family ATPase [Chloroflexi bacterium]|nr:AAA family ATPase [Chloroflexota bacterium]